MTDRRGPFTQQVAPESLRSPTEAPAIEDAPDPAPGGPRAAAMQALAQGAWRRPSRLVRAFWGLLAALLVAMLATAAWQFVTTLLERSEPLAWGALILLGAFVIVCLGLALREAAGFARLRRIDRMRGALIRARTGPKDAAERAARDLVRIYKARPDMRWARAAFEDGMPDLFDADAVLDHTERAILAPIDAAAQREIEAAARQVAGITALVPVALADVAAATLVNLRLIRQIGALYGGRTGFLGAIRLLRAVLTHLVATGAIAIGDDLLEPLLGGGLVGKVSRRFGEGLVNGALTARVGIAAMEVCRPMPFTATARPSLRDTVRRALAGLFNTKR